MTQTEKMSMLDALTGENNAEILSVYLNIARDTVLRRAFPFGDGSEEMPARYDSLQVEIAAYLLNKRGADGEISHSENGISRTYESGDVPASLLRKIVPAAEAF